MSNSKFTRDMSLKERERKILEMSDEDIDYSDVPPLDDDFFKNAKLLKKSRTEAISIRIDKKVLK